MSKAKMTEIEISLPKNMLLECLLCAHRENITFNAWANKILRRAIKEKWNLSKK